MPVSPQDFALWSNLTGNPYPQTPNERMALAPQVYEFNRSIGRRGGPSVSPVRRAVDVVGKAALAAGALAGAAYLGTKYLGGEEGSFGRLELDDEPQVPPNPGTYGTNPMSSVAQASGDITPPTTADRFNQDLIANQTSEVQQAKGLSSIQPTTNLIEAKPVTQSEVIGSQQHFSPGTEEEMLGQGAAEKAAAFRKSRAYSVMQQQYPGLQDGSEELIGGQFTSEVSAPTATLTGVQPSPAIRVVEPSVVQQESPVAAMVTPSQAPVTASVGVPSGVSPREIADLDATLARAMSQHTPEHRASVRDQMLAKKYPSLEPTSVVTTTQPNPVRVATDVISRPAKVKVNEFLSKMSQNQGPIASYDVEPSRSTAVSGVAFYPGGEVGVSLPTKANPAKEYVYGASDPLRLALSDYAEEGFPSGMGHLGKILGYQGIAPGTGMLQQLTPGGQSAQSKAPLYTGLMSEKEIGAIQANPRSTKAKVQRAGYDSETRDIMTSLQERAAARGR